ncbi:MAG TPA: hypothetical protein VL361_29565 [Candidatus Limnocylindrales bacterium]|nr:hypothetical protein [Candidatus Limnocylindrales bacterium]
MKLLQLNLLLAWAWILLGFLSGLGLGLFFHREQWLGGYASLKRRLYRLCHISFFGLGALNLCFVLTVPMLDLSARLLATACWAFIAGAVSMPVCCVIMAHFPSARMLFALPIVSLLLAGVLVVLGVAPRTERNRATAFAGQENHPAFVTTHH